MTTYDWIEAFLLLVIVTIFLQKGLVPFIFLVRFKRVPEIDEEALPSVSVLIPARNEEANLPACLDSLLKMDYPLDKLEILVGDDQSEDDTATIAQAYAQQYSHIHLHHIKPDYNGLVARSNVLAQLVKKSNNDQLIFLDADMRVEPDWLRVMVAPTKDGYNIVSGYTEVEANDRLAYFQRFDWMSVIMLLKAGADIGKPGTALGNNMLVSRKAYNAIGGYEEVGPTYTEDNDLTLAAVKKGYLLFQVAAPAKAHTLPMTNWSELCKQRKRWMQGAFKQPIVRLIPLLIARIFVLWAALALFIDIFSAIGFLILVSLMDIRSSQSLSVKVKSKVPLHIALFAPVFNSLLDTFTLLSYPWNRKVIWKGRKL